MMLLSGATPSLPAAILATAVPCPDASVTLKVLSEEPAVPDRLRELFMSSSEYSVPNQ